MKKIIALILLQLISFCVVAQGQAQNDWDKGWNWIVPLKTNKIEVEKVFGESIDADKNHPFQTYRTEFGKITAAYALKGDFVEECFCVLDAGTVWNFFISPSRIIKLSELDLDLKNFKKDDTYSPREIHYSSEKKGILIATKIVDLKDTGKTEVVFALRYERTLDLCATARCECKTQTNENKGSNKD